MAALGDTTGEKHKHVLWRVSSAVVGLPMWPKASLWLAKGPMAAAGVPRKQSCRSRSVNSQMPASRPQNRSICPSTCQPRCLHRAPPPTSPPAHALQHISVAPYWQRVFETGVETENDMRCYIQEANGPTVNDTQTPQALTQWLFITFGRRHIYTVPFRCKQPRCWGTQPKAPNRPRIVQLRILTPTTAHTVPKK